MKTESIPSNAAVSRLICLLAVLPILLAMHCQGPSQPSQNRSSSKPTIVATTGMVRDLVESIVGEEYEVIGLMGEGVDPHLYRPTASDTGKLMNADLIVYSGLHLEGAMQPAFEKAAQRGNPSIAVTAKLPAEKLIHAEEFESHPDPHVWGDVSLWMQCLDDLTSALSEFDPDRASQFSANAEPYRQQLLTLHQGAQQAFATIPESNRYLVTAHDAFGYLSAAYGLKVRSVQGISTASEAGVQDINNLVQFLVEQKIPSIFVEATVNSANIEAVIEGAREKGWHVEIGGTLYSDSLGAPGSYAGTYIGMMDSNITTIVRALGGEVPATGLNGKLNPPNKGTDLDPEGEYQ